MEATSSTAIASDVAFSDTQNSLQEDAQKSANAGELQNALEVSSEVDIALAYSSEKLANIEHLLLHKLAGENEIRAMDIENNDISAEAIENAITFDLLYTLLNCEVTELDNFMTDLEDQIVGALRKMSTGEHSTEVVVGLVSKLHGSEESLKQSQERALETKLQLAKLKMASLSSQQNEWRTDIAKNANEELSLASSRTFEERRTLRMLEKSLKREVELEKKLLEHKQNEDDIKVKMSLIEQVAGFMEKAAEVAWGRFLEADNMSEVLMGISKELLEKVQVGCLNPISSTDKEEEVNRKLQVCVNQLNAKETLICNLNGHIAELLADNAQVGSLRENVQMLEEKLKITESHLQEVNALNETSRQHCKEMEHEMEIVREKLYVTERKAESAEEKVAHLTDSNIEIMEELEFLKGSNDSSARKASELEKQVREFDLQLQHSRASSEASQEQQNMLYTAIWDMETLIDELKQKVAQSESRAEDAEERCNGLLKTNAETNKELEFLRSRVESMEVSSVQATIKKQLCAEDISIKTRLIMDAVMQLSLERERIQKQLFSVAKENRFLRGTLQEERNLASVISENNDIRDKKKIPLSRIDSVDSIPGKMSTLNATEISLADEIPCDASLDGNETESTRLTFHASNVAQQLEIDQQLKKPGKRTKALMFVAIVVVLLSMLAAHLFH